MAEKHSTTSTHLKFTTPHQKPTKSKHFNNREATISSSAGAGTKVSDHLTTHNRKLGPPTVVSPHRFFCCPASKPTSTLPLPAPVTEKMHSFSKRESEPGSPAKSQIGFSPDRLSGIMDPNNVINGNDSSFPSSFNNFNSALTAGLLNPISPPSPPVEVAPQSNKIRSSPTLFEMMSCEPDSNPKTLITTPDISISPPENQNLMLQRISNILSNPSPGNQFNDSSSSDIKLNLSSKDNISVTINVHSHILIANSRFFATKISNRWMKQQRALNLPYSVEICDCDDVLVYIVTLRLMYCKDVKKKLMKEDVTMVLGILKVSTSIGFDAGILSSLEYLEAAPWAEDEEENVALLLSELQLEGNIGFEEVLKRVSVELTPGIKNSNENEEILLKLLHVVLEGKDEKARREMKGLVLKMLRENSSQNELRKESLYSACDGCLELLHYNFLKAANGDFEHAGQISRHADNLNWVLEILIDRQIGEDFLIAWASQVELSKAHPKVPVMHRYAVSRVTARLFVGIGKGQILVSKETRRLLLQTWLVPFYDDFGWMRRVSKGLDRHVIEDGLSNTILTLPLAWQQEILLAWFNRFLNSSEDCPNIQRGFEVWWRRSFWRRNNEPNQPQELRVITATIENSL